MSGSDEDFPSERRKPLRRLQKGKAQIAGPNASSLNSNELVQQLQGLSINQTPLGRFRTALAARKPIAGNLILQLSALCLRCQLEVDNTLANIDVIHIRRPWQGCYDHAVY